MPSLEVAAGRLRPSIHPTYGRLIVAELRRRGLEDAIIFDDTELSLQALSDDGRYLSFEQLRRVVDRGLALTKEGWLGVKVGRTTPVSAHGALGFAAVSSPNVETALELLEEYASLRVEIMRLALRRSSDCVQILMHDEVGWGEYTEYVAGHLVGALLLLLEGLTGGPVPRAVVHWPFPSPPWAEHYLRILDGWGQRFDAQVATIELPLEMTETPCLTGDRFTFSQALRSVQAAKRRRSEPACRAQVMEALVGADGVYPTLRDTAEQLGMSPRTLVRRLSEEGTSFQMLLDEVRKEAALWLLCETTLSVEEVAERLGYGDASNFGRTCRRWFGRTGRELRGDGSRLMKGV